MRALARLAVAAPRLALGAWLAVMVVLALLGLGVEKRLTQSIFVLPGTETATATALTSQHFGESVFVPILLEGPPGAVDRQGPDLVRSITARPGWSAISPWDRGPSAGSLRPAADTAMVVASVEGPFEEIFDSTAIKARRLVDQEIQPPVSARITGMPVIGNAIKEQTYESAREAERIAIPILFVVLLFVFRAPVAALFPAVTGLATVLAASGVVRILTEWIAVDPLAISLSSMMGLALGVDYSLLIVSRFREQVAAGEAPGEAAIKSMGTAGRTVTFAGGALVVAMIVGILVSPGDILVSAAVGVITATVLGVLAALVAIPAALTHFGAHLDRFRLGRAPDGRRPRWTGAVRRVLAKPGIVALLVALPLLLLTAPAFGLNTGPPDVSQLSEDDPVREDFERISEVMGPGWAAPFEIIVVSEDGALTATQTLSELEAFQEQIAGTGDVESVVGPGNLASAGERQRRQIDRLRHGQRSLERGTRGLGRLARGIERAEAGVRALSLAQMEAGGLVRHLSRGGELAAAGARDIRLRLAAVAGGTQLIADAVDELAAGGERLIGALTRARQGTGKLAAGLGEAKDRVELQIGSAAEVQVTDLEIQAEELEDLRPRVQDAEQQLDAALRALDAMGPGRLDPEYQAAYDAVAAARAQIAGSDPDPNVPDNDDVLSIDRELELAVSRLDSSADHASRLARASERLAGELERAQRATFRLRDGLNRLTDGTGQLEVGAVAIADALSRLREGVIAIAGGAARLRGGLAELASGAGLVADGLAGAQPQVGALILGLGDGAAGADRLHRRSRSFASQSEELSDAQGIFDSGYFVLAAVDQAAPSRRSQAKIAVNVDSGGEAGRVLVVPKSGPNDQATARLREDLVDRAGGLEDDIGAAANVGGTAAALAEYDQRTQERLVWLVLALAVVSYFVLIPIFGSVLLPAIAVVLNLISVGATFGALALLFQGTDPILGGPGYLDAVSISAIYTVIFGLSLDYQVFLISRMREGHDLGRATSAAIAYGLERTGAVVTGAAAIMVAVFLAFASTDIAGTRQFGVGMVIAVVLDATLVRLLLLPATMRLFGDRCWSGPTWLARRRMSPD